MFYVYDRYDVWAIDPEAKADPAIFNISGRNTQLESRYVPVDPEQKYFRSGQRFYWRMVSQKQKPLPSPTSIKRIIGEALLL